MNVVRLMVVGNSMEAETICAVGDSGPREILVAQDDLDSARQLVATDAS